MKHISKMSTKDVSNNNDVIFVIPARGGSKRIKSKNLKEFLGEPILGKTISKLKGIQLKAEIVVSTDSFEIKEVAESYGASVPFIRPIELAGDNVPTISVIQHAVRTLGSTGQTNVICVYPTSVFLTKELICDSINQIEEFPTSIVFPVKRFPSPIERRLELDTQTSKLKVYDPDSANKTTQDLKTFWYDVSQFYVARATTWLQQKSLYDECIGIDADTIPSVDINDLKDWELAQKLYSALSEEEL